MKIKRIYLASPGHNPQERKLNQQIDCAVRQAGFSTFLLEKDCPDHDRLHEKLRAGSYSHDQAKQVALQVIGSMAFVHAYLDCDATVLNLDGTAPDEASLIAASIGFASGKPVVIYRSDTRTLPIQSQALISILSDGKLVSKIDQIPEELKRLTQLEKTQRTVVGNKGRELYAEYSDSIRRGDPDLKNLIDFIVKRFPRAED